MTSLEQHLADHAQSTRYVDGAPRCACKCGKWIASIVERGPVKAHRHHVADTWRESRTVRTVDELEALPQNSMTLDPQGRVWQHIQEQWVALGRLHAPSFVPFPVTVLWTPEDGAL